MKVINGNNIDLLKQYPDNYFDAVVTDPPYGLGKEPIAEEVMKDWVEKGYHEISGSGFMGKEWDAFVPQPIFWKEVFRVLKYGGHVLAFYGTRTYDWGVMSMRFAGFEVRDCIQWVYGSGFPKSHNISKAIDKLPKANNRLFEFAELLKNKRIELGLTIAEADDLICGGSTMYNFIEGRNINGVLKIYPPNKDYYEKIKKHYNIRGWDDIIENNLQIIGTGNGNFGFQNNGQRWQEEREIKEATTDAAKQWDGWGSALKPANEPIVLARKPLEKGLSIAENVLKWGTGGINIDGCRIATDDKTQRKNRGVEWGFRKDEYYENREDELFGSVQGRFPANLILTHHPECELKGLKKIKGGNDPRKSDGSKSGHNFHSFQDKIKHDERECTHNGFGDENGEETIEHWECHEDCPIRIMDEQSGISKGVIRKPNGNAILNTEKGWNNNSMIDKTIRGHADSGGSSRFFYCAKASKSERNNGLDGFDNKPPMYESHRSNYENTKGIETPYAGAGRTGNDNRNNHPTVKPVKLMQYLVRMITPPNGIVLDPFCGSGTTGIACKLEGFDFVGMEQDAEYCKIAEARIMNYKEEPEEPLEFIEEEDNPRVIQQSLF